MRKNPQITNNPRRVPQKTVFSQDSRRSRNHRKNENSQSPVPRETLVNKENIHPNLMMENSHSTHKIHRSQKTFTDNFHHLLEKGSRQKIRTAYYNTKNQNLASKASRIAGDERKSGQQYYCNYDNRERLEISPSAIPQMHLTISKANIHKSQKSQNFGQNQPKQITIKLSNRSLQKCQLEHQKQTPKAAYLVNACLNDKINSKVKAKCHKIDFICCEECAKNYPQKIALKNFGAKVTEDGLTANEYYSKLSKKHEMLKTCRENIKVCSQKFREMTDREFKKQSLYYNEILEIIEMAMKKSELLLIEERNLGDQILQAKQREISSSIKKIQEEMRSLEEIQAYSYNGIYPNENLFAHSEKITALDDKLSTIRLPIIHIFADWEGRVQKFNQIFIKDFSVKEIAKEDLILREQNEENKFHEERESKEGHKKSQNLNNQSESQAFFSNYSKKAVIDANDIDLFCDEEMGEKINSFSFQNSKSMNKLINPKDCIVQLVEEQDIISPAFKDF